MTIKKLYEIMQSYCANGWEDWEVIGYADGMMLPLEEEDIEEELLANRIIIY